MEYIGRILPLCKSIFWMVSEVKNNKKRCRRLAERVKALEELVESIRQRGPGQISSNMNRALWQLCLTLTTAQELVKKCTKTRFLSLVKCKSEFNSVNERLSDTFQVLSGALQVEQGSMMHRMFQDYTVEEDDDDWADGLGFYPTTPLPYSGATAPVRYPAAAAPRPQPTTAVYTAVMGVEDDTLFYAEAFFLGQ